VDKTTNFWSESNALGDHLDDEGSPLAEGRPRGGREEPMKVMHGVPAAVLTGGAGHRTMCRRGLRDDGQ